MTSLTKFDNFFSVKSESINIKSEEKGTGNFSKMVNAHLKFVFERKYVDICIIEQTTWIFVFWSNYVNVCRETMWIFVG